MKFTSASLLVFSLFTASFARPIFGLGDLVEETLDKAETFVEETVEAVDLEKAGGIGGKTVGAGVGAAAGAATGLGPAGTAGGSTLGSSVGEIIGTEIGQELEERF